MNNPILCPKHGTHETADEAARCLKMPVQFVRLMVPSRLHGVGRFSPSDCTGCIRKTVLVDGGAPVDLTRCVSRQFGSNNHAAMETQSGGQAEQRLEGTVFGFPASCRADRVEDGWMVDYKFPNPDSFLIDSGQRAPYGGKARKVSYPKAENVWQVQFNRFVAAQAGVETVGYRLIYGAPTSGRYDKFFTCEAACPLPDEDWLAAFRPFDGPFTARQLAEYTLQAFSGAASAPPARSLPMFGLSMAMGAKSLCDYCEVQQACVKVGTEDSF